MLMEICALPIGAKARDATNAAVQSRVFNPRICEPFRCLRFVELPGMLCCRKDQSSNSSSMRIFNPS
jgi:hypothetical protein